MIGERMSAFIPLVLSLTGLNTHIGNYYSSLGWHNMVSATGNELQSIWAHEQRRRQKNTTKKSMSTHQTGRYP
jgi:hypothetical protein